MKSKLLNLGTALSRDAQKKLVGGSIGDDGEGGSCSGLGSETCSASTSCTVKCNGTNVTGHCKWSSTFTKCFCVSNC